MLGLFGAIMFWALMSFITFKVCMLWFKLDICDDWTTAVGIFSFLAPLGYFGLFLVLFG
jgi:hypothetical protein